ncbi:MAG: F0F1 ATP synthase subunit B [Acetobacteraceae bacterium]|nr:F0F1 ATP synthase subunit B [Acetobacteraceae bacterium]
MEHHETFFGNPRTWIGLAFFIFYAIFGRKIWAAITGLLDSRAAKIRAELDEASRLRTEAEAMLRDAQSQREQASKDVQAMLDNARIEAANVAEAARKEAADAAKRRERMAMDRIGAAEKAAIGEVRQAAADIAARAAEQVIRDGFDAEQDSEIINRAISGLPAALASRRAA